MMLYNLGDSHTCYLVGETNASNGPWCPNIEDHYWYKIGKLFGCTKVVNESLPGRSNAMMIRLAMQHCLENSKIPTLYIINITTIFRFDLVSPTSHTLHKILTNQALKILDFETIECTLYTQLIGLIEFFKSKNKNFLIVNNGKNFSDDNLPMRDSFVKYFKNETRVLNWFDNGRVWFHENVSNIKPVDFKDYEWWGHDGVNGHAVYFDMLLTKLKDRNLLPS